MNTNNFRIEAQRLKSKLSFLIFLLDEATRSDNVDDVVLEALDDALEGVCACLFVFTLLVENMRERKKGEKEGVEK